MNWGYKLMWTFIVFAAMMLYLVFRSFQTNFELVEKDYYKNELRYQQVIDGIGLANTLGSAPLLTQTGSHIILQMPDEMKNKALSGSVWFYCAYNSEKDKKFHLAIDKNGEEEFTDLVEPGSYTVKIEWIADGKNYYAEKNLSILK